MKKEVEIEMTHTKDRGSKRDRKRETYRQINPSRKVKNKKIKWFFFFYGSKPWDDKEKKRRKNRFTDTQRGINERRID